MLRRRSTGRSREVGYELVVMGCSWGGLNALSEILSDLPPEFPLPIAVAQHRPFDSKDRLLSDVLQRHSHLEIVEPEDKEAIKNGRVYVAPPDYHLLVEPGAFALSTDALVRDSRPSIDVLFESAADAYADRLVGVILTGANDDGAAGLLAIKRRGGVTIVQEPTTAERREMPDAAIAAGGSTKILPLNQIGPFIADLFGGS